MNELTVVVMAAGMGSRYGGLKQIDPIGPCGEMIIDYSIYDALKAGFTKVVFIIRKEIEEAFRNKIGTRIEKIANTTYVYQNTKAIPEGFRVPENRTKPWGTGHAVLSCRDVVDSPFAVINADDFYGPRSFLLLSDYLKKIQDERKGYQYCMAGFQIENTLTEHGHVARGICSVDKKGYLQEVIERTKIMKKNEVIQYTEDDIKWTVIPKGSTVSMNMWGFTPSLFNELESQFITFMETNRPNLLKTEFFLPMVVDNLVQTGKAQVKVLPTKEHWYGVTYPDDKTSVKDNMNKMIIKGDYPKNLWEGYDDGRKKF